MLTSSSPLLRTIVRGLLRAAPSRPPIRGRRSVPGLRADVRIDWTEGGIPHLYASSAEDLFFAQGYVTASERLFQLDLVRRTARGEMAELFGARPAPWQDLSVVFRDRTLVDVDLFLRQLSLVGAAKASLEACTPETRRALEAHAAGVSAYLEEGARPLECQLLGYRPRPWTALDGVLVWKALAFQLSYGWRAGLLAEALRARFPNEPAKARALLPHARHVAADDVMLPGWPTAGFALRVLEGVVGKAGPNGGAMGGSNAFVIAPGRTESGRAMLAGDPHLPLKAPASGYLIHLSGGGFDVAGWSVPGAPGVVMGHNDRVAWSVTSGCVLESTWALEQPSVDGAEVRTARGFEPLQSEAADIFVRGEPQPVRRRVRHGPNGPIFDGPLLGDVPDAHLLALRWTGHLPTPDLDALLDMNRARSATDLRAAAAKYGSPAVNLLSADVDGHIAWTLAAVTPRFKGRAPIGAVPGWSPEHEWDGLQGPDEMPSIVDPPEGFLVSANQRLVPGGATLELGDLFEPPYRARRLRQLLLERGATSLDDVAAIQLDRFSGFGRDLQERFLRAFGQRIVADPDRPRGPAAQVLAHALSWDAVADPGSPGAAATWAFASALARALFEPVLGERLFHAVFEQLNLPLLPLLELLSRDGAPFWDRDGLDRAACAALASAADTLTAACGAEPGKWRLGALRQVSMRHPLGDVPALGALFTIGPAPHGGDGSTVNAGFARLSGGGAVEVGPAFRHAVECGAWDGYRVVSATGQGGDPASGRYRDHFPRWQAGGHFLLPFTREAVARAREHEATLRAAPPPGDAGPGT